MLGLLLIAASYASGNYPGVLESELGLPCQPQCIACHATNAGGGGTVTQAFGLALKDRGLTGGGQSELLKTALAALDADGIDSDGDGTTDVDALAAGWNPNGGDPFCGEAALPTPTYGCFNHSPTATASIGVLGALAVAVRRRRTNRSTDAR